MSRLLALQRAFQRDVLAAGSEHTARLLDDAPRDADARLAIYANAYRLRLAAALAEDYPKLRALLGDPAFGRLAAAYIACFPSCHPNIRWVGRHMPEFLRDPARRLEPVFAEVADFERALRDAFDAQDAPVLGGGAVAGVPARAWPAMRVLLHPSVHRLDFTWNAVAVWQDLARGDMPPAPQRLDRPVPWVVWRKALKPTFRSLPPAEAAALDALRAGDDIQTVCAWLRRWHTPEEIPSRVARWLGAWLGDGMVTAVRI